MEDEQQQLATEPPPEVWETTTPDGVWLLASHGDGEDGEQVTSIDGWWLSVVAWPVLGSRDESWEWEVKPPPRSRGESATGTVPGLGPESLALAQRRAEQVRALLASPGAEGHEPTEEATDARPWHELAAVLQPVKPAQPEGSPQP